MKSFKIAPSSPLLGEIKVPGDKSISHRAVMLASLSEDKVEIANFLPSEDSMRSVKCMSDLGVEIVSKANGLTVSGRGLLGLRPPKDILYAGNSGTTIRLMLGILAGQPFKTTITGDESIMRRPMGRVVEPLKLMGAKISGKDNGNLAPISVEGAHLKAIKYELPVASAQVKSAILLAALFAPGETTVIEKTPTRDHTERMLEAFGVSLKRYGESISLRGGQTLKADSLQIPSDISSAAYVIAAALLIKGSNVLIRDVGVNPGRTGIIDVLHRMGAAVEVTNERMMSGEPIADIRVSYSSLKGVEISGSIIPRLIDEIPIIALLSASASGETVIKDAKELRVKESDRIATLSSELRKFGAEIKELPDGMIIKGGEKLTGAKAKSFGDHRIAMTCAIAGLAATGETSVEDVECVETSFPGFAQALNGLSGAKRINLT